MSTRRHALETHSKEFEDEIEGDIGDLNLKYSSEEEPSRKLEFGFLLILLIPAIAGILLSISEFYRYTNIITSNYPYKLSDIAPVLASVASIYLSVILILVYRQQLNLTEWQAKFTKSQVEPSVGVEGILDSGRDHVGVLVSNTGGSTARIDFVTSGTSKREDIEIVEYDFLPRRSDRPYEASNPFIHPEETLVPLYSDVKVKLHHLVEDEKDVLVFPEAMTLLDSYGIERIFFDMRIKATDFIPGGEPRGLPILYTTLEIKPEMTFREAIIQQSNFDYFPPPSEILRQLLGNNSAEFPAKIDRFYNKEGRASPEEPASEQLFDRENNLEWEMKAIEILTALDMSGGEIDIEKLKETVIDESTISSVCEDLLNEGLIERKDSDIIVITEVGENYLESR